MDFGVAKEFDDKTRSNSMCGTLEYLAPEIILGKGHDKGAESRPSLVETGRRSNRRYSKIRSSYQHFCRVKLTLVSKDYYKETRASGLEWNKRGRRDQKP